jgi:hypothetical protein
VLRLACHADLSRLVLGPGRAPLDVGWKTRT